MKMTSHEIGLLRIISDSVDEYLRNKSMVKPEKSSVAKTMEMVLPKLLPTYHFKVFWHYTKQPFIACIRPDIDELSKKSAELVNVLNDPKKGSQEYLEKWCEIKNWEITLDPRILTKGHPCCVDSGDEFVAIICHEIGHVFNRDPIAFIVNYRTAMLNASKAERMMMSKSPIIRKLILPMFVHTEQFKLIVKTRNAAEIEIAADAYVPPEFAPALVSYIEHHVLTTPETNKMVIDKETFDGEQQLAVNYSRSTIDLMKRRRDVLKKQINAQYHSPDSDNYLKRMLAFMGKAVGHYDPNTDQSSVLSEALDIKQFERQCNRATMEAVSILEATKITDRELTMLEVEAESIETTDDKLWIIQTIYDYLEAISEQQAKRYKKMGNGKPSKADIDQMMANDARVDRLNKLRAKVMATKVHDMEDHYGVFVRYPRGYEG